MKHTNKIHEISVQGVKAKDLPGNSVRPDPEVLEKKPRRKFTAAYKLRILNEFDLCVNKGEKGALLHREGLYFSNICTWKRQREEGNYRAFLQGNEAENLKK